MAHYDVIVIGAGGVGSATLYHLAHRGVRAIGLDRFPPGHDHGSSHGETRIIRLAYHEHPDYVPLLLRAYKLWHELEQASGKKLLFQIGILACGPANGELISGMLHSAETHQLPLDRLTTRDVADRFSGFKLPDDFAAAFEQRAGYLMVEDCVTAHADLAVRAGAELHCAAAVRGWKVERGVVTVETDAETLSADRLVITAGAWASGLLATLKLPFRVLRKPLFWYRTRDAAYDVRDGCPCFIFDTHGGLFYGFPKHNDLGVKVAEHTGGQVVDDPLLVDRTLHAADRNRIEAFLTDYLPSVSRELSAHAVCMYTMSPDGHFVVGLHPEYSQVVLTAGLSGHGFKFTSVLGEVMADFAVDGAARHPIQFLSPSRFAV